MALAGAIYTDAPESGMCIGEPLLLAEMVIAWMAMGMFFFATIGALVLFTTLLFSYPILWPMILQLHLSSNAQMVIYCLPHISTAIGIFLTAVAYGIDIGERGGCPFLVFGLIAAPCFVFSIVALWIVGQQRRKQLFKKYAALHNIDIVDHDGERVSLLATWADRVALSRHGFSA
eukprot:scaffold430_cov187-Alexandrium_tamarense.AAC.12